MTDFPDGNTAALRQHESSEARAEAIYEAYAERVIEDLVDDVRRGEVLWPPLGPPWSAYDFLTSMLEDGDIDAGDIAALLLRSTGDKTRESVKAILLNELERRIREWCKDTTRGQDLVMERCREWDRDARGES